MPKHPTTQTLIFGITSESTEGYFEVGGKSVEIRVLQSEIRTLVLTVAGTEVSQALVVGMVADFEGVNLRITGKGHDMNLLHCELQAFKQ